MAAEEKQLRAYNALVEYIKGKESRGVARPEVSKRRRCIYVAPPLMRANYPRDFTPRMAAIGPLHCRHGSCCSHNKDNVKEEYFLALLQDRAKTTKEALLRKIVKLEDKIRDCYGKLINCHIHDFLSMILEDACFVIEHFIRSTVEYNIFKDIDPLVAYHVSEHLVALDMKMLENQLPFFLLDEIYKLVKGNLNVSFLDITLMYFERDNIPQISAGEVDPLHFTDLLRQFILSSSNRRNAARKTVEPVDKVYSISELWDAGMKFQVNEKKCFDIEFHNGTLTMPRFHVRDSTGMTLRNILALEQWHYPSDTYVAWYIWMLKCFIRGKRDIKILYDKKILVNWLGDDDAVLTMIGSLSSELSLGPIKEDYHSLCRSLNKFYEKDSNRYKARLYHEYFKDPWTVISTIADVLTAFFNFLEALCSILQTVPAIRRFLRI